MLQLTKQTFQHVIEKKMLLLTGLFLYNGYAYSFYFGVIPPLMPLHLVPWINLTFSLSGPILALAMGKGSDVFGIRWMMLISFILHAIGIILSFFIFRVEQVWLYFVTMFICGVAYMASTTEIFAVIGVLYQDTPSPAFAAYNFVQALSIAISLVTGIYFEYLYIQIVLIVLLVAAFIGFYVLDIVVQRVDKKIDPVPFTPIELRDRTHEKTHDTHLD
jgi:MFS family permease